MTPIRRFIGLVFLLLFFVSCSSSRMSNQEADQAFRGGDFKRSADLLRKGLEKEGDGRDQLLFLMDLGLVLHTDDQLEESTKILLQADRIAEIKDYSELAKDAATLVTSDNIIQYKGEDFEKVLINTYLAMNYAVMRKFEDALVEARRVNRKLYLMATQGKKNYKQNAFARYLSAILYEAAGEYDSAYIDYKKTWELIPAYSPLGLDLWRMSHAMRIKERKERWAKEFNLTQQDQENSIALLEAKNHERGEIIVIFENGISPIKKPHPSFHSVPKFFPRPNPVSHAEVYLDSKKVGPTKTLHDIESVAISNLDEKYAGIIAKKLAGVVAKEVIGDQVAKQTDSPLLGFITKVALHASDQVDVRSWNLLPKDLQLARFTVPAGEHEVKIDPVGMNKEIPAKRIQVASGQKVFVTFRFVP